ncbi:hypothetical protein TNCV_3878881 [Trichonephila clavipes]|nr:hypothetical protein TNCV_3878881 [Trichonephila clavipes]
MGSSVLCERLFSIAGNIASDERNRLDPSRLDRLLFLKWKESPSLVQKTRCSSGGAEGEPIHGSNLAVANVVPAPFDYFGDQKRMVLLPEEVGEKDFLESIPLRSEIDSFRKRHAGEPLLDPGWKQEGKNVLCMQDGGLECSVNTNCT